VQKKGKLEDFICIYFRNPSCKTSVQLFRYLFVGGTAFGVDFGLLFALTEFIHLHYLISAALAFLGGTVTNYNLSIRWVFPKGGFSKGVEFTLFAAIGLAGMVLNEIFMFVFVEWGHLHYLPAKICSAVLVFLWNFFARKFFVFSPKKKEGPRVQLPSPEESSI